MFTGIITDIGEVKASKNTTHGLHMSVKTPNGWDKLELGESIATNGVCLTVSKINSDSYEVFLMPETLELTSFGSHIPEHVNLERSLRAGDRFGGHFVQGHVDGIGTVSHVQKGADYRIEISYPKAHTRHVTQKGSISIDGVSLTIAECHDNYLTVALIPHTLEYTTLSDLKKEDKVNLEFDMIAKHIVSVMDLQNNN